MNYRNFFGALCLLFFVAGLWTKSPYTYWAALFTGALSRASARKGWTVPGWLRRLKLYRLLSNREEELVDKNN